MAFIQEDIERQECIKDCYLSIYKHIFKFHKSLPSDKQLHNILSQIIDRFERDSNNGKK